MRSAPLSNSGLEPPPEKGRVSPGVTGRARARALLGIAAVSLWAIFSPEASAALVRASFTVSDASRRDLNEFGDTLTQVSIANFTGFVTFDLQLPAESGTAPDGTVSTFWNPSGPVHFETDSPLQALLEGYAGDPAQGLTARTALVAEQIGGQASSSAFLRSVSLTPVGLLLFEIAGVAGVGDIPGIEAGAVRTPVELVSALEQIGTAKLNMTGYALTASGGFTDYGWVEGRITITSVQPVPLPASAGLLIAGLAAFAAAGGCSRARQPRAR